MDKGIAKLCICTSVQVLVERLKPRVSVTLVFWSGLRVLDQYLILLSRCEWGADLATCLLSQDLLKYCWSFLQYYQAALGNYLSENPRYVYCVYIGFNVHSCVFPEIIPKTYTVSILNCFNCSIFSLKPTYLRTLSINIIQSSITFCI